VACERVKPNYCPLVMISVDPGAITNSGVRDTALSSYFKRIRLEYQRPVLHSAKPATVTLVHNSLLLRRHIPARCSSREIFSDHQKQNRKLL